MQILSLIRKTYEVKDDKKNEKVRIREGITTT